MRIESALGGLEVSHMVDLHSHKVASLPYHTTPTSKTLPRARLKAF